MCSSMAPFADPLAASAIPHTSTECCRPENQKELRKMAAQGCKPACSFPTHPHLKRDRSTFHGNGRPEVGSVPASLQDPRHSYPIEKTSTPRGGMATIYSLISPSPRTVKGSDLAFMAAMLATRGISHPLRTTCHVENARCLCRMPVHPRLAGPSLCLKLPSAMQVSQESCEASI